MTLTLRDMDPSRLPAWIDRSRDAYADELMAAGEAPDVARENAQKSVERAFPDGQLVAGHRVFDVVEGDEVVGWLWIGPDPSPDDTAWWVWDIQIHEAHRGRGLGRAAMQLGEEHARSQGARSIGLNVFGSNTAARRLYTSLGFEISAIRMHKTLD
ncbi:MULTISPECIES: GNAT family N-acetyltransferase [unclassified Microbacterium]|uniref:GNAT family N-acetyltransferase n=1 Tax=Microbacterium sp. JZ37 TaxID=2654193 RepID=UPI002B4610A7|nr:GNAT family N-acetyltransferase [Microbacterium sp. JZ37]WRH18162.1 GNAT family N-acetyltransferase [Microbacterium sp. JZ37]